MGNRSEARTEATAAAAAAAVLLEVMDAPVTSTDAAAVPGAVSVPLLRLLLLRVAIAELLLLLLLLNGIRSTDSWSAPVP